MKRHLHRIVMLLALLLVIPTLCHAWSGKVVYVVDGDTITVQRDGKGVKALLNTI